MKKLLLSRKGFSRFELVLALLVIIGVIGVFVPRYVRYARASEAEVCALNRATILRLYKAHKLVDPDCTLQAVLSGDCLEFEDDTSDYVCPGGGEYRAVGETVISCSKHG